MTSASDPNPYEAPSAARDGSLAELDQQARIERLETRLRELERRMNRSGLLGRNIAIRALAIFGYWVLAYAVIAAFVWGLMTLFDLVIGWAG